MRWLRGLRWLRAGSLGWFLALVGCVPSGCPTPAPTLESISIAPENALVPQGDAVQFVATALASDGAVRTVTAEVSWLVDDALIARVDPRTPGRIEALAPGTTTVRASLGGKRASRSLTVTPASIRFLQVYPLRPVAPVGLEVQLQVFAVHTDQTVENVTTRALWRSADIDRLEVSQGRVLGRAEGVVELSVTYQGALTKVPVSVTSASTKRLSVEPARVTLPAGTLARLHAVASLSDGLSIDVTHTARWASSAPAVASVTTSPDEGGLVTGHGRGGATITAAIAGTTGSSVVEVSDAVLTQVLVSPSPATAARGTTVQLTATGLYSDGSSSDVTTLATWTSSAPEVATVDAGEATALAKGSTTVTATFQGHSGATLLGVSDATLRRLEVGPSPATLAKGTSLVLSATGVFSDGTVQDLTHQAVWTVADQAIAIASNAPGARGEVLGLALGTTTVTAEVGAVLASATLSVTAAVLRSVEVSPPAPALPVGTTVRLAATGVMSDGTTQDLTALASWSSASPEVATASSVDGTRGLVLGLAQGTATITATLLGLSGSTTVTVTDAVLVTLSLAPSPMTLPLGARGAVGAVGIYSDNSTLPLTEQVTWTSDDAAVATVDNAAGHRGEVRALALGATLLHARLGGVTASTTITVTGAALVSIEVSPATATVAAGLHRAFVARGSWSDHSTQDVTERVTWTSSAPAVAAVSNAAGSHGLATGLTAGTATITATLSGVSGDAALTVTPALLVALAVEPPSVSLVRGSSAALTARGSYSDGASLDVTDEVTWTSSAETVATVSNASGSEGTVHAAAVGEAAVTAQLGGVSGTAAVTVTPAQLVAVEVTPVTASAPLGTTVAFTATGRFNDGTTQDLTGLAAWTSSDALVASVSNAAGSAGRATALRKGSAAIAAAVGGVRGTAMLLVTDAALASIALSPTAPRLAPMTTTRLTATGTWTDGTTQELTTQATWASDAPAVAQVSNVSPTQGRVLAHATGSATLSASFAGVTGTTTVTVSGATVVAVDVTPSAPTVPAGLQVALTATGTFSDGSTQDLTELATWASSDATRATVSNGPSTPGSVTALAVGTPSITATWQGTSGSATVTVTSALLVAIDVTPASTTLPRGLTQDFTATGTFSDGSTAPITSEVVWSSSDAAVAPVSNAAGSQGRATALAVGTATITATLAGRTGTASLSVTQAALVSLAVTPASTSLPRGLTAQYHATGTYTDGTTQDVTATATWATGDGAIATISNGASRGLAVGVGVGSTTVSASVGGMSGSTALTVTPAELVSLGVDPVNPSVPLGLTQQLTATGVYTDGTTQPLTAQGTWSSSDDAVASVSNAAGSQGLATALSLGGTTITVTYAGRSGTTHLTVSAAVLQAIEVTPTSPTVPAGRTLQLTATGVYSDASTQALTTSVAWSTSAPAVASVSNATGSQGLASALTEGTATVTATLSGRSGSVTLVVSPAVLQAIQVTPANASRPRGLSQQFTATGVYSNGAVHDLTTAATWASSDVARVSVSNALGSQGLASTLEVGSVSVSATLGGLSGSTPFTVTAAELVGLDVTPASATAPLGTVRQLTATGRYTDGSTQSLTGQASWASSSSSVVSVSNAGGSQGLATTIGTGTATISASVQGFSSSMTMTVTQAALASIELTPANGATALGYTRQFIAVGTYTDGTTQVLTTQVTWSSSDVLRAIISNGSPSRGLLSTVSVGAVTISATYGGVTGSTSHTVTPAVLLELTVSPATLTLPAAGTRALTATGTFSDGSTQELTETATWTSSNPAVAQVSNVAPNRGLVTAIATGTATITATSGSHQGTAAVTVP